MLIGILIALTTICEAMSYYMQIKKTKKIEDSEHVSSASYEYKLLKYIFALAALVVAGNWVGVWIEVISLVLCVVALGTVAKYKPDDWSLF